MLKPGDTFERYTVDAVIGQGGMGCVYRAHDTRLERRVALKLLAGTEATPDANARMLREARAAAALDHPNAVSIFDVGEALGAPYIVMELVAGRTLRAAIGEATVPLKIRLAWLHDVARALAAAHKKGLVHRDIKPENVMVRDDGVVKVLDFGIARRATTGVDPHGATEAKALATLTAQGVQLGTPLYMAPEQIRGDALDGRADQFAWGVLAYELVTGKAPWRSKGDTLGIAASILTDPVDPAPLEQAAVPAAIREAILRALAKRPEDRFASMDEVARTFDPDDAGNAPRPAAEAASPAHKPAIDDRPAGGDKPSPSTTALKRYSTQEMRDVLSRALDRQREVQDGKFGFDELLAAATEVGVDAETLRAASRDLREKGDLDAVVPFEVWARRKRRGFVRHFLIYLITTAFLFVVNQLTTRYGWWIWPALGWGLGVAIHGVVTLMPNEDDWRAEEDWWRNRRRKRERQRERGEAMEKAIDEGVALLLDTGSKLRDRIAQRPASSASPVSSARKGAPSTPAPRARIAADTARAEAEAAVEEAAIAEAERDANPRARR